jgi:hypothetical protein
MAQHLTAAGLQHLMPPCWDSIEACVAAQEQQHTKEQGLEQLLRPQRLECPGQAQEAQQQQQLQGDAAVHEHLQQLQLQDQGQVPSCAATSGCCDTAIAHGSGGGAVLSENSAQAATGGSSSVPAQDRATASSSSSSGSGMLLRGGSAFVKHRRGVQGQAVYVARTLQQLLQLQQRLKGSSKDFIVQQEVPPLPLQGRKFVMRVHVLVVPQPLQVHSGHPAAATVRVYVHKDVVVLQHAQQYNPASDDSAVHISSRGKQHPVPVLLAGSVLPSDLQDSIWQQLQGLAVQCIHAISHMLLPTSVHPGVVLYHLFGTAW